MDATPPRFLIVAALLATAAVIAVVVFVYRSVKREQRGFDVAPPPPREPEE